MNDVYFEISSMVDLRLNICTTCESIECFGVLDFQSYRFSLILVS